MTSPTQPISQAGEQNSLENKLSKMTSQELNQAQINYRQMSRSFAYEKGSDILNLK